MTQHAQLSERPEAGNGPARPEPSPEAAQARGREAFLVGLARLSCPFREDSVLRARWLEGWDGAQSVRQALDYHWGREG